MRSLLLFSFLAFYLEGYGQIIDFPDANFKNALITTNCVDINSDGIADADADLNNDGEIQQNEASEIKNLDIRSKNIQSLEGIQNFNNLNWLRASNNNLDSLNYLPESISNLELGFCNLKFLDLSKLKILYYLYAPNNLFESLDLSKSQNVQICYICNNPNLIYLNIQNLRLDVQSCEPDILCIQGCHNIQQICCTSKQVDCLLSETYKPWAPFNLVNVIDTSCVGHGQFINFPDPFFKDALVNTKCVDTDGDDTGDADADLNDDGEIDHSEAAVVLSLFLEANNIASLDSIDRFLNLQNIKLHNLPILKKVEFSHLNSLVNFTCNFTPSLKSIKLVSLPVFENLHIYNSSLDTILLGKLESLDSLFIHDTNLKTISLDSLVLTKLIFSNNFFLKSIQLNNLERLDSLVLHQNRLLEVLNYSGKENLKKLIFNDNPEITDLGLSSFKLIELLSIQNANRIKALGINHLVNLEKLQISSFDSLYSMNISNLDKLQYIQIVSNQALYDISIENMLVLESLIISDNKLATFRIENTPQLAKLDCSNNILMELKISYSPLLKELICSYNAIGENEFQNMPNLKSLDCKANNLTYLDLRLVPKLESLDCNNNFIETIDFSSAPNLTELACALNNLKNIDVSNLSKLEFLDFFGNSIASINLGQIRNVKYFRGSANTLTSLNVNFLDSLKYLILNDNLIKILNISNKPKLKQLVVSNNGMTELELNNLPQLDFLDCSHNDLFSLNLNDVMGTYEIIANNCNLYEVLLKNGFADGVGVFDVNINPNLGYICVDNEIEKSWIQSILDIDQIKDVEINSYCSFQPGDAKYYVYSTVYYDVDRNGCTSTDQIIPYFKFDVKSDTLNRFYIANDSGIVTVVLQEGEHLITPQLENLNQFIITPQNILILL
ncbi:MAG: hypothetical protein IPN89_16650 [Saprospiraceae bacterium]|nr:hypothetical protein [Saprospiraceae bacterium]